MTLSFRMLSRIPHSVSGSSQEARPSLACTFSSAGHNHPWCQLNSQDNGWTGWAGMTHPEPQQALTWALSCPHCPVTICLLSLRPHPPTEAMPNYT